MISNETDETIKKLFEFQRSQEGLEKSMKGSKFVFDSVDPLYYKFHRISLNPGGSYIFSSNWLKNKKATINPKHNKCFQYAVTALHHKEIKKDPQRISKLSPLLISIIGKK